MINGVNSARINNTQVSFKKTIDGVEISNNVRKVANEYVNKDKSATKQRKNAIIEFFKNLFGHKTPEKPSYNMRDKYGYGHMSH